MIKETKDITLRSFEKNFLTHLMKEQGITLVALVVTIIVLLILAGITIQLVLGENGIIGKARDSKKVMNEAQIKEELQLAIHALQSDYHTGNNTGTFRDYIFSTAQGKGQEKLKAELGANNISFNASTYIITYKGLEFSIADDGTVTKVGENANPNTGGGNNNNIEQGDVDFDSIIAEIPTKYNEYLAEAQEKGQTTSQDIGIGTDGNVIDLDLWNYVLTDDGKGVTIGGGFGCLNYGGFKGTIENGEFPGGLPEYVFLKSENKTLPVVGFGGHAFYDNYWTLKAKELQRVIIPATYKQIIYDYGYGEWRNPFEGCTGLTEIIVDSGNPIYDSRNNCNAIISKDTNELVCGCKATEIPSTVTSIGDAAFNGCNTLTSINIPSSVTSIGHYSFSSCSTLTSINIPSSVTSIGQYSFSNCSGLTSFTIPSNVSSIGDFAFANCTELTSINVIGKSGPAIGWQAFWDLKDYYTYADHHNVVWNYIP